MDSKNLRFLVAACSAYGALLILTVLITTAGPTAPGFISDSMLSGFTGYTGAAANSVQTPLVTVRGSINGSPMLDSVPLGGSVTYVGTAADADGGMTDHWLEIENPEGKWSWQGWLTTPEWSGGLSSTGTRYADTKQATIKFTEPGTYVLRTTAIDEHKNWVISNLNVVNVSSSTTTPYFQAPIPAGGIPPSNSTGPAPTHPAITAPAGTTQPPVVSSVPPTPTTTPGTTATPPATALACSSVGTNAFFGCYYTGMGFTGLALTRTDSNINFDWGTGSPDPKIPVDHFSVRWTGTFAFSAGTYVFSATTDDGMRVSIDGSQIINSWKDQGSATYTASKTLTAGSHLILVEYYENTGQASARFSWTNAASLPVKPVTPTTPTTPTVPTTTPTTPVTPTVPTTPVVPTTPTSTQPVVVTPTAPISDLYKTILAHGAGWSQALLAADLGPSYADMHGGVTTNTSPTNYMPANKTPRPAAWWRINPYQVGGPDSSDNDYWSTGGQVAYLPDSTTGTDPGLSRIQTFAYYDHVFATAPKIENLIEPSTSGNPTPKPHVVAEVRDYQTLQNEALVLYDNGLLSFATLDTSRNWDAGETNWPTVQFPSTMIPTGLAITSENEFALVSLWDTTTGTGKVAVIALEGKYIPYHTTPYMGLINEGSWSAFKLLGYVTLPFAHPTSIAAATNGHWGGPSDTNSEDLGQISFNTAATRNLIYSGNWNFFASTKGYAIVASETENQVAFIDLTPLTKYIRDSYFGPTVDWTALLASRGPGASDFPKTFAADPAITPTVYKTYSVTSPTAVLAGQTIQRWSTETNKAYVAEQNGTIHIYDTSFWMARPDVASDKKINPLAQLGSFMSCKNPTDMAFTRFGVSFTLPGQPATFPSANISHLNDTFYVACRGDREVDAFVSWGGTGYRYLTLNDSRLNDPVAVDVADRGNIVTVADYSGKQLISFRIGNLTLRDGSQTYKPGANGTAQFEVGGTASLPGKPYSISEANVN